MPVHGGLFDYPFRIFTFTLKGDTETHISILFEENNYVETSFSFPGIDNLCDEALLQLLDRTKIEEKSVLKQAFDVLKGLKRTGVYCPSLEKRITELNYSM